MRCELLCTLSRVGYSVSRERVNPTPPQTVHVVDGSSALASSPRMLPAETSRALRAATAAERGPSGLEAQMPTLSYRCTEANGLSFELLVDDQPLGALVGSRDTAFPYWIVEDGLPRWPPQGPPDDPEVRIVCV